MATYAVTLSKDYITRVTYPSVSLTYNENTHKWNPEHIDPPSWKSGRKRFLGYYAPNGNMFVMPNGDVVTGLYVGQATQLTEQWETLAPAAVVISESKAVAEIAYDGGTWFSDYRSLTPLDSTHPIEIPRREMYRFIGCYSTNGTTGTKYINADGTPTAAFLALAPTADLTIYVQWELASVKITINASYGEFAFKTFYQSLAPDGDGLFGYYTDDRCQPESRIYGIPIPTRELYDWDGLRKSSSSSSTVFALGDGGFTDEFLARAAAATTVYGSFWEQIAFKLTVNANGGTAPVQTYYLAKTGGGVYPHWLTYDAERLSALPIPNRPGYRFLGYYNSTSGTTLYVAGDGTIKAELDARTASTTVYAKWRQLSIAVTLDDGRGSGGDGSVFYDGTAGDTSFVNAAGAAIQVVAVPSYTGNSFNGYFDSEEGGTKCIAEDGSFVAGFAPSSNVALYAQYTISKCEIAVERGEGDGGVEKFWYDMAADAFYADADLTVVIDALDLPTLHLYGTDGLFTDQAGGTVCVGADGSFADGWAPSEECLTVYAQYTRRCYEVALDTGGGACGLAAIYHAPTAAGAWYADEALTDPVSNIGATVRAGYVFGGFSYCGVTIIGTDGSIAATAHVGSDYTATAEWTAKTYTLSFSAPPGSTISFTSMTVTFGQPIGNLPVARRDGINLEAWMLDDVAISVDTVWAVDGDAIAMARWADYFGTTTDYFGLGDTDGPLMLVSSTDGATRSRVDTCGTAGTGNNFRNGHLSGGAFSVGGIQVNPICTYRVRKTGMVKVQLGKAFGVATVAGTGTAANPYMATRSGYMLVQAEYATAADGEPVLTVRGAANEGYVWTTGSTMRAQLTDAINRWDVNLTVSPDHVAQDPMSAVMGGGELTECRTLVTCDPVVQNENGMPCSSDIVRGRIVVTATTTAYFCESAPLVGGGFVMIDGTPKSESDVDFVNYAFSAERSV